MTPTELLHTEQSWIQKRPNVCGGNACIRDTRVPVWSLVVARRLGTSDEGLLKYFVTPLSLGDVRAAFDYFARYPEEIEEAIQAQEV